MEARRRWDNMNKISKFNTKVGDMPHAKYGCDDITTIIAFF